MDNLAKNFLRFIGLMLVLSSMTTVFSYTKNTSKKRNIAMGETIERLGRSPAIELNNNK